MTDRLNMLVWRRAATKVWVWPVLLLGLLSVMPFVSGLWTHLGTPRGSGVLQFLPLAYLLGMSAWGATVFAIRKSHRRAWRCPRCNYPLGSLADPPAEPCICPECGFSFWHFEYERAFFPRKKPPHPL